MPRIWGTLDFRSIRVEAPGDLSALEEPALVYAAFPAYLSFFWQICLRQKKVEMQCEYFKVKQIYIVRN